MAIRPLLTTGAALISAGALVAATPALFVPNDEVKIAASTVEQQGPRTLTVEQYQLLAITLEGLSNAFFDGYGIGINQGGVGVPQIGADGQLVLCTEADGDDCGVTQSGLTGVGYYVIDDILGPNVEIDNVLLESGFKGTTGYIAKRLGIPNGVVDRALNPQLSIDETVVTAAQLVFGENSFVANLVTATFYSYNDKEGWLGAANFIADTLTGQPTEGKFGGNPFPSTPLGPPVTPVTPGTEALTSGADARTMLTGATETEAPEAEESGPGASNVLTGRLVNLRADLDAGALKLPGLPGFSLTKDVKNVEEVKDEGTEEITEGTDEEVVTPVGSKIETPSFPKFQLPKPVFKAPIAPEPAAAPEPEAAPEAGAEIQTKPKFEAKIHKAETEETTTDTGSKGANFNKPEILLEGGPRKADPFSGLRKINDGINNIKKALGGDKEKAGDSGSDDSGSDSSGGGE